MAKSGRTRANTSRLATAMGRSSGGSKYSGGGSRPTSADTSGGGVPGTPSAHTSTSPTYSSVRSQAAGQQRSATRRLVRRNRAEAKRERRQERRQNRVLRRIDQRQDQAVQEAREQAQRIRTRLEKGAKVRKTVDRARDMTIRGTNAGPRSEVLSVHGKPTKGTPTVRQVVKAQNQGTLRVNQNNRVTTPQVRQVSRQLVRARRNADVPGLDAEQERVARTVVQVGRRMGATPRELLAAVETGLVESGLRNLSYGDADSQGWRQERTSIYGTGPTGPTNVRASARRFFEELRTDPGTSSAPTTGLLAQAAQGSAFPDRYDAAEPEARSILSSIRQGNISPKLRRRATRLGLVGPKAERNQGVDPKAFRKRYDPDDIVVLPGEESNEGVRGDIAPLVNVLRKRFNWDITAAYDPGGNHVSSGHNVTGTALDIQPADGNWKGKFAQGLQLLVNEGFEVLYDGQYGTIPYANHGEGNHAHVEFLPADGTQPGSQKRLIQDLIDGKLPGIPKGSTILPSGSTSSTLVSSGSAPTSAAVTAYAQQHGVSKAVARKRLKRRKPSGQDILAKLKSYGLAQDTEPMTEVSLSELEKKYGSAVI